MIDPSTALTGGGAASLVLAVAYGLKQAADWWQTRDASERGDKTAAVTDAGAANALILASLRDAQEREAQLSGQVEELRAQNSRLYETMRQQRKDHDREMAAMRAEYETEISELRKQVDDFSERLADLQRRLRPDQS